MKVELFGLRFRFDISVKRIVEVTGINSNIADSQDDHILLWDFDNSDMLDIALSLRKIQRDWGLPKIHIVQSSPQHYHALCFTRIPKPFVLQILSSTPNICDTFFKLGVMRGYWTLRITPKQQGHPFKTIAVLSSEVPEDLMLAAKLQTVTYTTAVNNHKGED